jgi:hypothetical protein
VSDFLLETRRGPDYQFASAAAVMLRTLGYSTRLAGGFYVSPERYDRLRAHTPVAGSDAHLWLEVHYTSKVWLTLDPTPGYEVLGPPPGWWERTLAQADAIGRWIAARWAALLMLSLMAFVTWWRRVWRLDRLTVARWYAFPASTPRDRILQTAWLIETRLWLANHPRRPGQTWAALFSQLPGRTLELHRLGTSFASLADWAVFAPESEAIPESAVVRWDDSCRRIVEALHPVVRPARGERWGIRGWKFGEAAPC